MKRCTRLLPFVVAGLILGSPREARSEPILYTLTGEIRDGLLEYHPIVGSFLLSDPIFPIPTWREFVSYTLTDLWVDSPVFAGNGSGRLYVRVDSSTDRYYDLEIGAYTESDVSDYVWFNHDQCPTAGACVNVAEQPDSMQFGYGAYGSTSMFLAHVTSPRSPSFRIQNLTAQRVAVPEPGSLWLLTLGILTLGRVAARRPRRPGAVAAPVDSRPIVSLRLL